MAPSSSCCLVQSPFSLKGDQSSKLLSPHSTLRQRQISMSNLGGITAEICGQRVARIPTVISDEWSFLRGARVSLRTNHPRSFHSAKSFGVAASWFTNSQIASNVFTLGTVAVLPFYTFMVVAPKAELTKKSMESAIPYVGLGLLYGYLLYLSWTPETMQTMFASKYWLPELPGIAKMFSREMTLASAWIHLLAVDLFAASIPRFTSVGIQSSRHGGFLNSSRSSSSACHFEEHWQHHQAIFDKLVAKLKELKADLENLKLQDEEQQILRDACKFQMFMLQFRVCSSQRNDFLTTKVQKIHPLWLFFTSS